MSEPIKRRSLVALATPSPVVDEATIAAVAARHNFPANATPASQPEPEAPRPAPLRSTPRAMPQPKTAAEPDTAEPARRKRQLTGRNHQFNTRLRKDTCDYIYGQANGRDIPIAQVIEEMVEAHKRQQGRG